MPPKGSKKQQQQQPSDADSEDTTSIVVVPTNAYLRVDTFKPYLGNDEYQKMSQLFEQVDLHSALTHPCVLSTMFDESGETNENALVYMTSLKRLANLAITHQLPMNDRIDIDEINEVIDLRESQGKHKKKTEQTHRSNLCTALQEENAFLMELVACMLPCVDPETKTKVALKLFDRCFQHRL